MKRVFNSRVWSSQEGQEMFLRKLKFSRDRRMKMWWWAEMEVKGQQWSQCFSAFSLDIAQCCCKLQFTPTGCCDSRIVGLSLCPNDLTYKMEIIDFSHFYHCCCCLVTKLCQTLCDPMDCSPPSSSVHGDSPGKNTGAAAIFFCRGSSPPRDQIHIACIYMIMRIKLGNVKRA